MQSVANRSYTPLRHHHSAMTPSGSGSTPSTPVRSSAVAAISCYGQGSAQRPSSRLHGGSPAAAGSSALRPTHGGHHHQQRELYGSGCQLAASFSYLPTSSASGEPAGAIGSVHHAPPLNNNGGNASNTISTKPPLSGTPTNASIGGFPTGLSSFSLSNALQQNGTPVKQQYSSWIATNASTNNSTPPPQRRPLGDASFITQAARQQQQQQQGGLPSSYQYTPVKMPPTPSRGPALQFSSSSVSNTPSRTSTPCGPPSLLRPHAHQHQRPLLVLDLDETLVHASVETTDGQHDVAFVVEMNQQKINVFVKIRPFAKEFLRRVGQLFEVCVFTASLAPYADRVVDYLDPSGHLVHHRLYREHCTNVEGSYVKDMSLMGRSMERVAIVDNSPVAYSFHPENAIPILSWFDDRSDRELMELMPMLEHFAQGKDFFHTRRKFQLTIPTC